MKDTQALRIHEKNALEYYLDLILSYGSMVNPLGIAIVASLSLDSS